MSPTHVGYGGGAITIEGSGFSEDVFNQFDPVLGNKVIDIVNFSKLSLILQISVLIGAWMCNSPPSPYLLGNYDRQTNKLTNRRTDRVIGKLDTLPTIDMLCRFNTTFNNTKELQKSKCSTIED